MSIRVQSLVWEHSQHEGNDLLLLLAIADHADDAGQAFPSIGRLAKKARMAVRTVQYALDRLKRSGELTVHIKAGPRQANLFQVNLAVFRKAAISQMQELGSEERQFPTETSGAKSAPPSPNLHHLDAGVVQSQAQSGATAIAPKPSVTIMGDFVSSSKKREPGSSDPRLLAFQTHLKLKSPDLVTDKADWVLLNRLLQRTRDHPTYAAPQLCLYWDLFVTSADKFDQDQGKPLAYFAANINRFVRRAQDATSSPGTRTKRGERVFRSTQGKPDA